MSGPPQQGHSSDDQRTISLIFKLSGQSHRIDVPASSTLSEATQTAALHFQDPHSLIAMRGNVQLPPQRTLASLGLAPDEEIQLLPRPAMSPPASLNRRRLPGEGFVFAPCEPRSIAASLAFPEAPPSLRRAIAAHLERDHGQFDQVLQFMDHQREEVAADTLRKGRLLLEERFASLAGEQPPGDSSEVYSPDQMAMVARLCSQFPRCDREAVIASLVGNSWNENDARQTLMASQ
jgi:hypothetical protein